MEPESSAGDVLPVALLFPEDRRAKPLLAGPGFSVKKGIGRMFDSNIHTARQTGAMAVLQPRLTRSSVGSTALALALYFTLGIGPFIAAEPLKLHPENPHYFLFRGKPTVLIT
ncbi:MAG: hypothetical protein ACREBC_36525, partial [Pyrinomonadaceae bacterium]